MPGIDLYSAGCTDRGKIREVNEDDYLIDNEIGLFAVADGLGGHGAGSVASSLAIETLQEELHHGLQRLRGADSSDSNKFESIISQAISEVNRTIYDRNKKKGFSDGAGMGTTLVGICFLANNNMFISFNIGDSRLYRSSEGILEQSTKDHSLLQEWHDMGEPGEAPAANLLKKAVGLYSHIDADLITHSTRPNELLMLCSDGLTSMVDDTLIEQTLNTFNGENLDSMCSHLIERANEKGGQDNITVVTVKA